MSHTANKAVLFRGAKFIMTGEEVMDNRTTVFIADGTEEFCGALSNALSRAEGFQVIGTACDGEQAIRLIQEKRPDVLLPPLLQKVSGRLPVRCGAADRNQNSWCNIQSRLAMLRPDRWRNPTRRLTERSLFSYSHRFTHLCGHPRSVCASAAAF